MSKAPNGMVIYSGPSAIDGAPIVCVLTGLAGGSANRKTGAMLQTWILRADRDPVEAIRTGADGAICGTCPHRGRASGGSGACYVTVWQGPLSVYRAWQRGRYPLGARAAWGGIPDAIVGSAIRIGAYGDPAAIPDCGTFWTEWTRGARLRAGYTHRWRDIGAPLRGLCMASVDSEAESAEARELGWATFRIAPAGEGRAARMPGEAQCPAATEAGKRVECAGCPIACDGSVRRGGRVSGRVIRAHGTTRRRFAP